MWIILCKETKPAFLRIKCDFVFFAVVSIMFTKICKACNFLVTSFLVGYSIRKDNLHLNRAKSLPCFLHMRLTLEKRTSCWASQSVGHCLNMWDRPTDYHVVIILRHAFQNKSWIVMLLTANDGLGRCAVGDGEGGARVLDFRSSFKGTRTPGSKKCKQGRRKTPPACSKGFVPVAAEVG